MSLDVYEKALITHNISLCKVPDKNGLERTPEGETEKRINLQQQFRIANVAKQSWLRQPLTQNISKLLARPTIMLNLLHLESC